MKEIGEEKEFNENEVLKEETAVNNASSSFADSVLATKDKIVVAIKPLEPYLGKFLNILSVALSEATSKAWKSKEGVKLTKILEKCEGKLQEFLERYVDKVFKTSFARDEVVIRQSVRVIVFAPPFLTTIFFMSFFSSFLGLNDSKKSTGTVNNNSNKFSGDTNGRNDQTKVGTAPPPQQSIGVGGGGSAGMQQQRYQQTQSASEMIMNPMIPPNAGVVGSLSNDISAQSVPFIPGSTTVANNGGGGMNAGNHHLDRNNSGDSTASGGNGMSGGGMKHDLSSNTLIGRPGSGEHPPPTMMGDLATAGVSSRDNDDAYKAPPKFGVPHGEINNTAISPTAGSIPPSANLFVPSPATSPRATAMGGGSGGGVDATTATATNMSSSSVVPILQNPPIPQLDRALTLTSPMQEQRLNNTDGDVDAEIKGGEIVPPPPIIPVGAKKKETKPPAWAKNARGAQVGTIPPSINDPSKIDSSSPPPLPLPQQEQQQTYQPPSTHQHHPPGSVITPQQSMSAQTIHPPPGGGSARSRPLPGVPIMRKSVSTGSKVNSTSRRPPPGVKVLSRPPPGISRAPPPTPPPSG